MRIEKLRAQARGLAIALVLISIGCGSKNPAGGGSGSAGSSGSSGSDVATGSGSSEGPTGLTAHTSSGGIPDFSTSSGKFGTVMQGPKSGPAPRAASSIPADPVTSDANLNLQFKECGTGAGGLHHCFNNANPFFQSLGTNGRACITCHPPSAAMTVTPPQLQALAAADGVGLTPDSLNLGAIFRAFDGANNPNDPNASSTTPSVRQPAYSLLLAKGLIRIGTCVPPFTSGLQNCGSSQPAPVNGGLPLASSFQFNITNVVDPYGFGTSCSNPLNCLDFKRRPVPLLSMRNIVTIMWDGRESPSQVGCTANGVPLNPVHPPCKVGQQSLTMDFGHQANGATQGHAQSARPLTTVEEQEILNFQFQLAVAQTYDNLAGDLTANGARGGPTAMLSFPMFVGINDNFGNCADESCKVVGAPLGIGFRDKPFNTNVFTIYDTYALTPANAQQASIARGQAAFNGTCTTNSLGQPVDCDIPIANVNGINDQPAFCALIHQSAPCGTINGACTTCHDSPNIGNHTVARQLNIGLAHFPEFMTDDLPTYTFTCNSTGQTAGACTIGGPDCTGQMLVSSCGSVKAQDGGKAMISGLFSEIGMFKGAHLRGLTPRPPFFHDGFAGKAGGGSAGDALLVAVQFYEDRFGFTFDPGAPVPRIGGCGNVSPPQSAATCPTPNAPTPTEVDLVNFLQAL